MSTTLRVQRLCLVVILLVTACGGTEGATTTAPAGPAPTFVKIAAILDSEGLPCDPLLESSGTYLSDAPMALCNTPMGSVDLALWPQGIESDAIESWALASYCDRVDAWKYVDVGQWTGHPFITDGAQDEELLNQLATASGGTIVTVTC